MTINLQFALTFVDWKWGHLSLNGIHIFLLWRTKRSLKIGQKVSFVTDDENRNNFHAIITNTRSSLRSLLVEFKVGKIQVCWSLNWWVGFYRCAISWKIETDNSFLFSRRIRQKQTFSIREVSMQFMDLISISSSFLLLLVVDQSDLEKGSNFCHRFLLTSIIYQNKHTDWSYRKCKSQKSKSGMKDTVFENHSKSLIFQHLWICKRPKLQPTYNFQFEFSRQTSIMTNICRWYFGIFGLKIQTSVARFDGM